MGLLGAQGEDHGQQSHREESNPPPRNSAPQVLTQRAAKAQSISAIPHDTRRAALFRRIKHCQTATERGGGLSSHKLVHSKGISLGIESTLMLSAS